jgi:hypothetical protein
MAFCMPGKDTITREELARLDKRTPIFAIVNGEKCGPCEYDAKLGVLMAKYTGAMMGLPREVEIDGVRYRVKREESPEE